MLKKLIPFFKKIAPKAKSPFDLVCENTCPECLSKDTLLAGPEGGMSRNIACKFCGSEFNFTPALRSLEPYGTLSPERGLSIYGISPRRRYEFTKIYPDAKLKSPEEFEDPYWETLYKVWK